MKAQPSKSKLNYLDGDYSFTHSRYIGTAARESVRYLGFEVGNGELQHHIWVPQFLNSSDAY